MAHRDELAAARARVEALERENAELRTTNAREAGEAAYEQLRQRFYEVKGELEQQTERVLEQQESLTQAARVKLGLESQIHELGQRIKRLQERSIPRCQRCGAECSRCTRTATKKE
jgi:chromosome segregation ATPase